MGLASLAFAFLHGGMWAWEELSQPFCADCRDRESALALTAGVVILCIAIAGVFLWLRYAVHS